MQALGACYVGPNVTYSGYIKLYTNRWVANVLAGDCVQGVHKNVKYGGGGNLFKMLQRDFYGFKRLLGHKGWPRHVQFTENLIT